MQPRSVYLAGPIAGLSYCEARNGWRTRFAGLLGPRAPHVECYSPMRAKDFLSEHSGVLSNATVLNTEQSLAKPLGILCRDFNDVAQRDAMVVNFLGAKAVSIGTVWEMGAAYTLRKPVVVVMEKEGNPHDHVFVTHSAGYVVDTLDEAAAIIAAILSPGL